MLPSVYPALRLRHIAITCLLPRITARHLVTQGLLYAEGGLGLGQDTHGWGRLCDKI